MNTIGYAAKHSFSRLKRFEFERDEPQATDVVIDILFCGVCHSDIHQVRNEWSNTIYPCVPGHEIVGRVTAIGGAVSKHAVGDLVGVGCMIESCRSCPPCTKGDQNYCEGNNGWLATYNGPMVPAKMAPNGSNGYGRDNTFGGYANNIVVHEDFVLKIPAGLRPEIAAPILCAGVTTYSPLKHWNIKPGDCVGIVGLGGLGHMAVKLAKAMGAHVTAFTSHRDKVDYGDRLGVDTVEENDKDWFEQNGLSFDFILSTIPEKHDINPYIRLLKRDCTIVVVGALESLAPVNNMELAFHRRHVAGSLIGNLADTQQVLDFCAAHRIGPDVQVIPIDQINEAYKDVVDGDVRFRYVIDMASLRIHDDTPIAVQTSTATEPADEALVPVPVA
jgi:alcohol dehydrogenase (NADP+)